MEIQQLKHLIAAVECGNLFKAAEKSCISQSGLSRSIKSLETRLGVPLLVRGPKGVEATVYGLSVMRRAQVILNEVDKSVNEVRAIEQGRAVALANKEALVCAGELVMRACAAHGTTLLPIDSEHNAIFQVLDTQQRASVEKITLTASGGPLLHRPLETMRNVTPEEAVNHPRWSMGAKISVDSATMMNKGLELIEAHYLFAMPPSQLEVLIHPESVVHSLVHYADGSVLAQLGCPDMAIPIACVLGWPQRLAINAQRLDLAAIGRLNFSEVEAARFPALALARAALAAGAAPRIALNAANEVAVARFLAREIPFTAIAETVARVMEQTDGPAITSMDDVLAMDAQARGRAAEIL